MRRAAIAVMAAGILVVGGAAAWAEGDPEKGADVFKKCRACHLIGEGAKDSVGPNLTGVIGRKAGTSPTYKLYSDNMKELGEKGTVWNDETLDRYLENPKAMVPNGKMAFPGLKDKDDRADVIAYIKKESK